MWSGFSRALRSYRSHVCTLARNRYQTTATDSDFVPGPGPEDMDSWPGPKDRKPYPHPPARGNVNGAMRVEA